MIRVAVVDDQDLVRAGFVLLLRSAPEIEVIGEASSGLEAIALCRRASPDVVLMDVRMPHLDGLAATRAILAEPACQGTRVIVLTTFDETIWCWRHCAAAPAASCSKTSDPTSCSRPSRWWPPARPCCIPESHGG